MNHWIVIFQDAPEMLELRKTLFEAHVAYLTSQPDIFVDGTSLAESETTPPVGGMWIVQAESRDDIIKLIEGDPMFQPEFRQFEIFATGKRLSTG